MYTVGIEQYTYKKILGKYIVFHGFLTTKLFINLQNSMEISIITNPQNKKFP